MDNLTLTQKHIFIFSDDNTTFSRIGLATFNIETFSSIWNQSESNVKNIFDKFDKVNSKQTILDIANEPLKDGIYITNINTKKTIPKDYLYDLIDKYETNQLNTDETKIIREIMASINNCVQFSFKYSNKDYNLKFYFLNKQNKPTRNVISQGMPTFTAAPKVLGTPYSHRQTSILKSTEDGIGTYAQISAENDPYDFITAEIDLSYDNSSKKWVAGNQTLAKLITNVEAAEIKNADITENNINGLTNQDYYDPDSDFYMGGHKTGKAIPLSVENGNPNIFGPNIIQCGTQKAQIVRVVNRSARSFTIGSIVLLNKINNEWIIQDFGTNPEDQKPSKVISQKWSFIKLIANSDSYFKDDRFFADPTKYNVSVKPGDYELSARYYFYENFKQYFNNDNNFLNTLYPEVGSLDNTYNKNKVSINGFEAIIPSKKYFISTIFDQTMKDYGGFNDINYWNKTNQNATENKFVELGPYGYEVPLFWGPIYVDGYILGKILLSTLPENQINENLYFDKTDLKTPVFTQENQIYKNFPAELSSNIIDLIRTFNYDFTTLGSKDDLDNFKNNIILSPYNESQVSAINKIQFSPLQAEMAGHDDILSKNAINFNRNFFDAARKVFNVPDYKNMWGNMFTRCESYKYIPKPSDNNFDLSDCNVYSVTDFTGYKDKPHIPYDCFIKNIPTDKPIGAVREFRDNNQQKLGSNLVGIIAAIHRINKRRGGNIIFDVDQDFGLNQQQTVTGFTEPVNQIAGWIFGGGASSIRQNSTPQWGSASDSYDSFGTTALHVRVFDGWPSNCTVYDPRYFAVLHFNPGKYGPYLANKDENNNDIKEYDIDVRVPTDLNDNVLPFNTRIDNSTQLKPQGQWRINTIRRGQLLTAGGFLSAIQYITLPPTNTQGYKDNYIIYNAGSGFAKGQIINTSKGIQIKIEEVDNNGGIVKFIFSQDSLNNPMSGEFIPQDFTSTSGKQDETRKCYKLNVSNSNGNNAIIEFYYGIIDYKYRLDLPPKEQIPITRLTDSSNRGNGFVRGVKTTEKSVEENNDGNYDCFYLFHNDIGHTFMQDLAYTAGFAQSIVLTIS